MTVKIGILLGASAVVAAAGSGILPTRPITVTLPYFVTATIDTSNTTVGIADSNLYGMTRADIDRSLDAMQAMGVNDVRVLVPWAGIEPLPGYDNWGTSDYIVNAADERGMGVLGVLTATPYWAIAPGQPMSVATPPASNAQFADFASQVATRYAGKVSAYEVWNEPNAYFSYMPKPDPAGYTRMLQALYPAIKAADPDATVIGGVLGSVTDYGDLAINPINYVNQMYAAGAQGSFDALSLHPYQYTLPFSQGAPYGDAAPIVQMEKMHQLMVANGDGDKLIWASEYGSPTSVVSESTQAAMIQDYLSTWSQFDYAGPSFIYTTKDVNSASTTPDDTFGLLRDDWSWKPAASVVQQWTAAHPQQPVPVDLMAAMQTLAPNAPVAVDTTSGALTTIDPATGQPVPVTTLATETRAAATQRTAPADPITAVGEAMSAMATNAAVAMNWAMGELAADVSQTVATAMSPAASPTVAQATTATIPTPNPTMVPVGIGREGAVPEKVSATVVAPAQPTETATTPDPSVSRQLPRDRTRTTQGSTVATLTTANPAVGTATPKTTGTTGTPGGESAKSSATSAPNGTSASSSGEGAHSGKGAGSGPRHRSERSPGGSSDTSARHAAQPVGSQG